MTQFKILFNPRGLVALQVARFVYNAFNLPQSTCKFCIDYCVCIYTYSYDYTIYIMHSISALYINVL